MFLTQFGIAVPASTMTGVEVECENDTLDAQVTLTVQLSKNGSTGVGTAKTSTSSGVVTLGGDGDLWGTTLLESQIENANFGLLVSAVYAGVTAGTAAIDRIRLRLYYGGVLESLAQARPEGTM
jgi:hypothetical protein